MPTELPQVTIHTDGGCDPNPGPGGWAAVLSYGAQKHELAGREARTTNNRMELTAAIKGLETLKRPCHVDMYTDSQYLRRGITQWITGWQRNGWRTRSGKPVENQDLWQALLEQVERHQVEWHWVRGHDGNALNERADRLATGARRGRGEHPAARKAQEGSRPGMPAVELYCQGSCRGNPGPGGYAAVVVTGSGESQVISDGWPSATSNTMELWAVIAGLRNLKQPSHVTIHTSSKYVIDGATRWLADWETSGWMTRKGSPVQNAQLWQELANVMGDHDIRWQHASAAAQNEYLQMAQRAARGALQSR